MLGILRVQIHTRCSLPNLQSEEIQMYKVCGGGLTYSLRSADIYVEAT